MIGRPRHPAGTSNLTGLAMGRQWVGSQHGIDVAAEGLAGRRVPVLSGSPHASAAKALAVLGLGRSAIERVDQQPGREAIDLGDLERRLQRLDGEPAILIASAGTVNTVDFDDLPGIARLRDRYPFWLHVDGAFGAFAATSPTFADRVDGLEHADTLAPVRLNVVCFTLDPGPATAEAVDDYVDDHIARVNGTGEVLVTATRLDGIPAVRAAFSNSRTTAADVERAREALRACLPGVSRSAHPDGTDVRPG